MTDQKKKMTTEPIAKAMTEEPDETAAAKDDLSTVYQAIRELSLPGLAALAPEAYAGVGTEIQRRQIKALFLARAEEISPAALRSVSAIFRELEAENRKHSRDALTEHARRTRRDSSAWLETDAQGLPTNSLDNFLNVMLLDPWYKGVRFNLLKNRAEKHWSAEERQGCAGCMVEEWTDVMEAESERHIEETYGLYHPEKHRKAFLLLLRERSYNPVHELLDSLPPWDGVERISSFLAEWMKAEDTPYTREISRLIFAGGINRICKPGCKFDCCPVLIGLKQGEGKSTLLRWLALQDDYYTEVTDFEGREGIEALDGAWICEISEMLALTREKEQEAVKAYITRQEDRYRKPYAVNPERLPRHVIFIGTTNNQRFLRDKTGNRRFFPVNVNVSGRDLFAREKECREFIRQCWAEARDRFRKGEMNPFPQLDLESDYISAQEDAMEDDWREGAMITYLSRFMVGSKVCCRQICREALCFGSDIPHDPDRKESHEIGQIMDRMPGWERLKGVAYINAAYPSQRGWRKVAEAC